MSNPHIPIDPELERALVEARSGRWLDPDPLTPTELDQAYALGFEDGWDSTKPRPHRSRLELVVLVGAIAALVIVAFAYGRATAAPRSGQTTERVDLSAPSSAALSGAPRATSSPPLSAAREVGIRASGAPMPDVGTAVASGIVAYAARSFGDRYLAVPAGPGVRVRICASISGLCLQRISTDAGPELALQRAGRLADVSFVDFAWLCRCDPPSVGLLRATIEYSAGPTPPATGTEP